MGVTMCSINVERGSSVWFLQERRLKKVVQNLTGGVSVKRPKSLFSLQDMIQKNQADAFSASVSRLRRSRLGSRQGREKLHQL